MVAMIMMVDRCEVTQDFIATLSDTQLDHYHAITKERRQIYVTGYIVGLLLTAIWMAIAKWQETSGITTLCTAGSIIFLSVYFYYLLAPKRELMVVELTSVNQRKQWAKVYRTMQYYYHLSFLFGIIAVLIVAKSYC